MTADKQSAAPPVEREKFEAVRCREEFIKTGMWPNEVMYQNWCRAWKAALLASAPIPAGQEVRMLTVDEIRCSHPDYMLHDRRGLFAAVIRKFCEVNGLKLAPATTKEK